MVCTVSLIGELLVCQAPGKYVTPEPGFVVKTRTEDANAMKVSRESIGHDANPNPIGTHY